MAVALLVLLMEKHQLVKVSIYVSCDLRYTPLLAVIICPALMHPMNGQIDYYGGGVNSNQFQISFGTIATYTCVHGFALICNNTRTCTGDGSSTTGAFSGIDPTCERE